MVEHIAPRGEGAVGGEQPGHIGPSAFGQFAKQPGDADDTAAEVSAGGIEQYSGHDLTADEVFVFFGHDAKSQWQQVGRDGIVGIEDRIGIQQMFGRGRGARLDGQEGAVDAVLQFPAQAVVLLPVGLEQMAAQPLPLHVGHRRGVRLSDALEEDVVEVHHQTQQAVGVATADELAVGDA